MNSQRAQVEPMNPASRASTVTRFPSCSHLPRPAPYLANPDLIRAWDMPLKEEHSKPIT